MRHNNIPSQLAHLVPWKLLEHLFTIGSGGKSTQLSYLSKSKDTLINRAQQWRCHNTHKT
jgi:hypothetical protein